MSDEPKLLPCPFCGHAAYNDKETWRIFGKRTGHEYAVACEYCESVAHGDDDKSLALAAWNTRATPPGMIRLDAPELLAMVDALKMCRNDLIGWLRVPNIDEDFNTDHSHHALQEAEATITAWEKLTK